MNRRRCLSASQWLVLAALVPLVAVLAARSHEARSLAIDRVAIDALPPEAPETLAQGVTRMSTLSNIPPQAVLPLGAYDRDALRRAGERADQRLLRVDCANATDKRAVLAEIAQAFALPAHFGHNLDALYDCVTDLQPCADAEQPGFLLFLENLPDTAAFGREQRDALLDVFRDAAGYFFERETAFRVFYSVRDRRGGKPYARA